YDAARLRRLWAGLPVTTHLLSHFNARLYPIAGLVRSWSRWRGRATGRAGTDVSVPIAPINAAPRAIFAGGSRVLVDLLHRRRPRGSPRGLSLVALPRRDGGEIAGGGRPADVEPDTPGGPCDAASHHRGPVL